MGTNFERKCPISCDFWLKLFFSLVFLFFLYWFLSFIIVIIIEKEGKKRSHRIFQHFHVMIWNNFFLIKKMLHSYTDMCVYRWICAFFHVMNYCAEFELISWKKLEWFESCFDICFERKKNRNWVLETSHKHTHTKYEIIFEKFQISPSDGINEEEISQRWNERRCEKCLIES